MDALIRWLLTESGRLDDVAWVEGFAEALGAAGVPVDRLWMGVPRMHPLLVSSAIAWTRGRGATSTHLPLAQRDRMQADLAGWGVGRGAWGRHRLAETAPGTSGLPEALWTEGYTEILLGMRALDQVANLREGTVQGNHGFVATLATRAPGGFDDAAMARLAELDDAWFAAMWLRGERRFAEVLAETYLGRDPGAQALSGRVHRGDATTVRAAIAFADLRGFSALSEAAPPEVVLALLNDFYDALVPPIEGSGGDVLQFMGDGLLAIWPDRAGEGAPACDAALGAMLEARDRIAAANRARAGRPEIRHGVALHYGDVSYGNMGAAHRLAFTALGPAVNRAARLEAIGARLGLCPVLSDAFARATTHATRPHGRHEAKGVGELEAWGLASG